MLNLWRRHLKACPHRVRTYKKCGCPIWVQGTLHGKWMKKSLDLRNWEAAQKLVREWEAGANVQGVLVKDACGKFLLDCEARKLGTAQLGKYKLLTAELDFEFAKRPIDRVNVDDLRVYRESWKVASVTAGKKLERLKTFFKFAQESGWVTANPAKFLKAPIAKPTQKLPFSDSEMEKILWAADQYPELYPMSGDYAKKVKPFILVLRYAGFRIRDCVCLKTSDEKDGKILIHTQKTGTP